jgi:hypothetical protein
MPALVTKLHRIVLAWAWRRSLGLSSACGIGIALAACAATWFSGGTRTDIIRGAVALWAGYLIIAAARNLGRWQFASRTARSPALRPPGPAPWLAALGSRLAECIVYAGLAAGATAEHWTGVWALAIAALAMAGIRDLMTTCSTPPGLSQPEGLGAKLLGAFLTMPFGGRVLLVGIAAPIWGTRAALLALLEWSIIAVGYGIAGRAVSAVSARQDRPGEADAADTGDGPRSPEATPRVPPSPDPDAGPETEPHGAPAMLVRLRDDGVLARMLGTIVRGNLLPLPPAVLGLVAVAAFAILGLHALPGILMIGPAIVMLLAAPGSSSHHAGRFDWLVPVLLLGAQLLYLTAAGLASGVPGPVVFVLCSAVLLRYCDLAFPGRPVMLARRRASADADDTASRVTEMGTSLGWEGRMLVIGLGAALGIGLAVYLVLSGYLVWLIAAKIVAGSAVAVPEEGSP